MARRDQDKRLKDTRTSSPERHKGVWLWKPQSRCSFEALHCSNHSSRFWIYAVFFTLYTEKTKAKSPALSRRRTDAAPVGPGDPSWNLFSCWFLHIVFVDLKEKCKWTSPKWKYLRHIYGASHVINISLFTSYFSWLKKAVLLIWISGILSSKRCISLSVELDGSLLLSTTPRHQIFMQRWSTSYIISWATSIYKHLFKISSKANLNAQHSVHLLVSFLKCDWAYREKRITRHFLKKKCIDRFSDNEYWDQPFIW